MRIAIDASRINRKQKTGVENYSTQLLKYFKKLDHKNSFVLYTPRVGDKEFEDLPKNFVVHKIPFPRFWTQVRFAFALLRDRLDLVFIPSHVSPFFNFKRTVVTIHDIAYKKFPESYPLMQRIYLDLTTKHAIKRASKIITISESTRRDLIKHYGADHNKIFVTYLGYDKASKQVSKPRRGPFGAKNQEIIDQEKAREDLGITKPFLFYLGRLETKKNISNLLKAFYELLARGGDYQVCFGFGKRISFQEFSMFCLSLTV